jgi:hypothetical protein
MISGKAVILLLWCFILSAAVFAQTSVAPRTFETDFQLWNDTQFIVPLTKKKDWNFVVWMFGRVGNDVRTVTDARIGGLITKRLNKNVTLGGGVLYRYSNPTFRRKLYETRYLGMATVTVQLPAKVTLVNRNLLQYENRYSRPNSTVIRNRFWFKREIVVGETKIEPFVSFEQFYDMRADAFVRNRIQTGFTRKFNNRFSGDFFYVRQNEGGKRTRPGSLNGIGTSFRFNL